MPLDEWQEQALEAAMGERTDGRWAAKFVGVSAPRQNGKSQLIVARALAGALLFGEKMIIISAHETDTAREIWKRLIDVIESNPTLEARVTGRMDAINREFIAFGRGVDRQTIKLKARRASGARGFSADCLLLDEAQILGKSSWGSIVPTMSAMPNPQMWLFGTPPTETDDPFAFARVRESAVAKKARHCWLEWSAKPGDDFDDPDVWAKANPAYGVRISYEACADDRAAMDDAQFARERLGMWDEGTRHESPIPEALWRDRIAAPDDRPPLDAVPTCLAVDRWHDGTTSVSAAWQLDERTHVELVAVDVAPDTSAVVEWIAERAGRKIPVMIAGDSPAAEMIPILKARGVRAIGVNTGDYAKACVGFVNAATENTLSHAEQEQLTAAVAAGKKKDIGQAGAWGWDRRSPELDISGLVSVTLARFGATSRKRPSTGRAVFA